MEKKTKIEELHELHSKLLQKETVMMKQAITVYLGRKPKDTDYPLFSIRKRVNKDQFDLYYAETEKVATFERSMYQGENGEVKINVIWKRS